MATSKMHINEVETDVSLVHRLIKIQFPQWANLPIKPVPSAGTDNALYRLGEDMAVRLPRIDWAVKHVDKEYEWLPRIAPLLPIAVPVPFAKGMPGEGYPWPWSVYQWIKGENPTIEHISEFGSLATEVAQFVTALHSIDLTGGPNATRGVPLQMRDVPTRTAIKELDGIIDIDAVTTIWDAALQIPVWSDSPVWIHGDLSPGNLLCMNHKLCAVIDFGGLGMGDPACDLIVAWNLLPANMRKIFRTALKVDDDTWMRGRGWALSVALIQLPYYLKTSPVIVANAQHVINEVLIDYKQG